MRNKLLLLFLLAMSYNNATSQSCYRAINLKYYSLENHPTYNWVDAYTITGCANTLVELKAVGNMYCNLKEGVSVYWYNTTPNSNGSNYFSYSPEIAVALKVQTIYMRTLPTSSTGQQYVNFTVSGIANNIKPAISGTTDLCNTVTSSTYTGATDWSLTPSNAGTITTNTNTCTITWTKNYVGTVQLKGRTNATSTYCGYSPWSDDLNITLNPLPSAPTITQNGNSLQSSSTSGNQWYNQTGIINGAINQNFTPTENGNYYVILTASGCSSTSSNTINYGSLSIQNFENNAITIYPNPTNDKITIDLGNLVDVTGYQIKIYNQLGQIVFSGVMNTQQYSVSLNSLTTGVHLVKIYDASNHEIKTKKIILQ